MGRKAPTRATQSAESVEADNGQLTGNGAHDSPELRRLLHEWSLDGLPYVEILASARREKAQGSAVEYLRSYLEEMKPRNPVERMLAIQMLWQHARVGQLAGLATQQTVLDSVKAVNAAVDSAMNTYRRQATAWEQLRSPTRVQFIRGDQVNVADQQIVANQAQQREPDRDSNEKGANELGLEDVRDPPQLPAQPQGPCFIAGFSEAEPAMGAEHRAPDDERKGSIEPQRSQARPAKRRGDRRSA